MISLRALPATALLAALLALAPACARKGSRGPRSSAASDAVLAAAVIDFHDGHVDTAGDAVGLAIRSAVTARDLQLRELPAQVVTTRFPALPEPDQRLAQLTTFGRDAAFLVLVEARAQYQAPAGARFRWLVHSRTSGDRPDVEGEPLITAIDIPVLIPGSGPREKEAVAAAAPAIGGQVASLLDSLLVEP
ncbi:MAG TPA: hypothetical protein VND93_07630 [Myxococcales bacterium]|nr:hypothetical protein [Myxococcales bacterium]